MSTSTPVIEPRDHQSYVDGEWIDAASGETTDVVNPATETTITRVPACTEVEIDMAVAAATRANLRWARTTPGDRAERLLALADALQLDAESFAQIEAINAGKPIDAARGEVRSAVDRLRFFAGAARCLEGRAAGEYVAGYTSFIRREPVGVTALITPWNYPLLMAVTKLAPALAAGNTVVLKPSEQTPLTTLRLASLSSSIFPAGVINVVTGEGPVAGAALVRHRDVGLVSLTGDSATGREVAAAASQTLKRVHLELGGKAPAVVLGDADPVEAARALRDASFWNAGQDCSAATRLLVSSTSYDRFAEAFAHEASALRVGQPFDAGVEMGPLVYRQHRDRVAGFISRAKSSGASVLTGGGSSEQVGYFVEPTVIVDATQDSEIVQREVFGPVVTLQRFEDDEAALQYANDVSYGLSASIFTRDVGRALSAARRLKFGTVWINDHGPVAVEMPWGGHGESGYGRERSIYAIEEFTELKHVMIKLDART